MTELKTRRAGNTPRQVHNHSSPESPNGKRTWANPRPNNITQTRAMHVGETENQNHRAGSGAHREFHWPTAPKGCAASAYQEHEL